MVAVVAVEVMSDATSNALGTLASIETVYSITMQIQTFVEMTWSATNGLPWHSLQMRVTMPCR